MKLLILLKSLQQAEYKDFEKFLQSPFFKASEQYLKPLQPVGYKWWLEERIGWL